MKPVPLHGFVDVFANPDSVHNPSEGFTMSFLKLTANTSANRKEDTCLRGC